MWLSTNKDSLYKIIGIVVVITFLRRKECADVTPKPDSSVEDVEERVKKLLASEKFNLTYFTDFSKRNYKMFNESKKAMVSSDDVRCSRVGEFYLANGGNAIDSAIAASLCLTVIEFSSTGLAGGGISLSLMNGKLKIIDFRQIKPSGLNLEEAKSKKKGTFGIPGMIMGLHDLWKAGGNLEWKSLFDLPIVIALKGWQIKPSFYYMAKSYARKLKKDPFLREMLFEKDVLKPVGSRIANEPLAKTLHLLSLDHKTIYTGDIAKKMIDFLKKKSIFSSLNDFSEYKTSNINPIIQTLDNQTNMVTSSNRSGGPILISIINNLKNYQQQTPAIFKPSARPKPMYFVRVYDSVEKAYRFPKEISKAHNAIKKSKNFYKYAKNKNAGTETLPNYVPPEFTSEQPETTENKTIGDTSDIIPHELHGTASVSVIDSCGNGVSMASFITGIFGYQISYPDLGFMVDRKQISWETEINNSASSKNTTQNGTKIFRHVNYLTPVLILNKKHERIEAILSATGGIRIPAVIAQVLFNHYYRNATLLGSIKAFRISVIPNTKTVLSERVKIIPRFARKSIANRRRVKFRNIKYIFSSTVSGIKLTLDENAKPTNIIGVGDFRRFGGAVGL